MAKLLIDTEPHERLRFVFMNTGCEEEETLRFVAACDREFGMNLIWLEGTTNPVKGKGVGYRIVNFATASRNGEPFEAMIQKHGIPNVSFPHCTRELKRRVLEAWARGTAFARWKVAIGIRADEPDRIKTDPKFVYPLFHDHPTTKAMVNDWWEDQTFNLNLSPHRGNCIWCWKKSQAKLIRIARETPEAFAFPALMEAQYRNVGPEMDPNRSFFRGRLRATDIVQMAESVTALRPHRLFDQDEDAGCAESCEVFA
jgi:hypothetical protein